MKPPLEILIDKLLRSAVREITRTLSPKPPKFKPLKPRPIRKRPPPILKQQEAEIIWAALTIEHICENGMTAEQITQDAACFSAASKAAVKNAHPDRHQGSSRLMVEVNQAIQILKEHHKK